MSGFTVALLVAHGVSPTADEAAVVAATNAERATAEAKPLAVAVPLLAAARGHAVNMAKQDILSHELDGQGMADRVKAVGYVYQAVGENVAAGHPTPAAVVAGWMDSDGHKANLLNPDFTQIGVAATTTADGKRYWVQVFGTPRD